MSFLPLIAACNTGPRQLVATLGPASWGLAREIAEAGASAFRLNASHLPGPALAAALDTLRRTCPEAPVVIDLQGAKMRLGHLAPTPVRPGERLRFSLHEHEGHPLPHPELYRQARPGETLSVDDGRLRFVIAEVGASSLVAVAAGAGTLQPRKGVNVEEHPVELEGLTAGDREACAIASRSGVTTLAFSFMSGPREAAWLREAVPGCVVIGKVERREATLRLDALAGAVDATWICRGDLGAQLGDRGLAEFVGAVDPRRLGSPVLMAGQVLEHLTGHPEPTRSEVCHLYDLLTRGYSGIVLSDETAMGTAPVRAVATASRLLRALSPSGLA